ncbi:MAG: dephospho-CoA kinase [Anaerolineae bacterium]|nr:dephospho-CoA kinase [Anaerolineae bacterium]
MTQHRAGTEEVQSQRRDVTPSAAAHSCEQRDNQGSAPYRIGLTGNIATGKSTVGRMLASLGAELIDADRVAHAVIAPAGSAYAAVIEAFGPDIVDDAGAIDRRALGRIVFADPEALKRLEALVHPAVIAEVNRRIARSTATAVVVEAIKLLESGMAESYDALWVTTCSEETQLARLMETRGLSREDALVRIRAQAPQAEKALRADVVVDTDVTLAATRAQVEAAWADLQHHLDR